jgi:hypothetical protein
MQAHKSNYLKSLVVNIFYYLICAPTYFQMFIRVPYDLKNPSASQNLFIDVALLGTCVAYPFEPRLISIPEQCLQEPIITPLLFHF